MKKYNILYFYWNEVTYEDMLDTLRMFGQSITVFDKQPKNILVDDELSKQAIKSIKDNKIDFIFSFNYFPILAEISHNVGILYVSWVYDCPHMTLDHKSVVYDSNIIFHFDKDRVEHYKLKYNAEIYHMPLACNTERIHRQINNKAKNDVTFLGSTYQNEYRFYDKISYLPKELKDFLEELISSQQRIWGYDFVDELFGSQIEDAFAKYVKLDIGDYFYDNRRDIFLSMIYKEITVRERENLLKNIGDKFNLTLYSEKENPNIKCSYMGYANYYNEMPQIFANSKINLNLSLRSITSGIPLRCIDIMGVGGFLLSNYQKELSEYFEADKEFAFFTTPEEMMEKIAYYLSHDEERNQIALAGQRKVSKCFSYEVQVGKILNFLSNKL